MQKLLAFCKKNMLLGGFLALLCLPYPLWWALQGVVDTTNYENRVLTAFPTLATTAIADIPAQIESWIGDSAPFRNQFMRLNATLNWAVGTLDSDDVILGEDSWLFLKDSADSNSLSDYQGLTSYTEEEQAEILAAIYTLSDALSAYDCELVITIAPAKEGVYSEYMPEEYVVTGETRVQTLVEYLSAGTAQSEDISIVWPKEALQEAASEQQVYYKYDTHWNNVGGWIAAQCVLEALDLPYQSDTPNVLISDDYAAPNDLADVSATWAICTDDIYYVLDEPTADYTWIELDGYMTQFEGDGDLDLLLVRDSFGDALAPYLAAGFAHTDVLHGNVLSESTLIAYNIRMPDVMVIEVGERYSDNLLSRINTMIELVSTLAR